MIIVVVGQNDDGSSLAANLSQLLHERVGQRVIERGRAARVNLFEPPREKLAVCRKIRDDLNVIAEADNTDAVLGAGGSEKIARGLADEIDVVFDAAGNVQQEHQIERL